MKYYVVDAFTSHVFHGNPAGVCVLDENIESDIMQQIAAENNLSETAFLLRAGDGYQLRWFTPGFEIDLCGHATLASAFVVFHYLMPERTSIKFETMSGELEVKRKGEFYEMEFPCRPAEALSLSEEQIQALGCAPMETYGARDLMVVLSSEADVLNYVPDYAALGKLSDWLGIIITAPGENADFVSRYFCPELALEDPVTGSSHCNLIPYWSERLGKRKLTAEQLSKRRGTLYCEAVGDKVKIAGEAVLYLQGEIC